MKRVIIILALLTLASTAFAAETSVGVLWSTGTGILPALQGSLLLGEYHQWELWGDLFAELDLETAGAGASIAAPPGTPVISPVMDALDADRGGIAVHRDFRAGKWGLSLYVIYEF